MSFAARATNSLKNTRSWLPWLGGALGVAVLMAALDAQGAPGVALLAYAVICLLGAGLLALAWRAIDGGSAPRAIGLALVAALLLRLLLAVGLFQALPVHGYDEKPQNAGYIYYDAYARDTDAWARGRSDQPLLAAFGERKASDQYGGVLFLSSAVHRYLSEGVHRPLLVALLAVAVSSSAVLFTWGAGGMLFGRRAGVLAAWTVALYPDFALLGASQMREAFLVPALGIGLYGYARARIGAFRSAAGLLAAGLALALIVSPPYALLMVGLLGFAWFWEGRGLPRRALLGILAVAVVGALALFLTSRAWSAVPGFGGRGLGALLFGWLQESAQFELRILEQGSGWVQKLFEQTPSGLRLPLATVYGLSQPFLPAALADNTGAPLWQAIAIFRALGWFALLPFLLYTPVAALRSQGLRSLLFYFSIVVWIGAVLASYRAAGDMWDNPRYRAAMLVVQAILVGWGWVHAQRTQSPWLRRTIVLVGIGTLIFLHWYIGRYFGTPRLNLMRTAALTGVFGLLWLIVGLWQDRRSQPRGAG